MKTLCAIRQGYSRISVSICRSPARLAWQQPPRTDRPTGDATSRKPGRLIACAYYTSNILRVGLMSYEPNSNSRGGIVFGKLNEAYIKISRLIVTLRSLFIFIQKNSHFSTWLNSDIWRCKFLRFLKFNLVFLINRKFSALEFYKESWKLHWKARDLPSSMKILHITALTIVNEILIHLMEEYL